MKEVCVVGAGIIGVLVALELQTRGAKVTLVDRSEPGEETSYGNAGILSPSAIFPINNSSLWKKIPHLLRNRSANLRYNPRYITQNLDWLAPFLKAATISKTRERAKTIGVLLRYSILKHIELLRACRKESLISDNGWYYLYRSQRAYRSSLLFRNILEENEFVFRVLDKVETQLRLPFLNPIFERAIWIECAKALSDPRQVVNEYAQLFVRMGGAVKRMDVGLPVKEGQFWKLGVEEEHSYDALVLCLGPWTKEFLKRFGYHIPMAFERGYHLHFSYSKELDTASMLSFFDVEAGYVLSPMEKGLRLLTGVELNDRDSPPDYFQIERVEASAREAVKLGKAIEGTPWLGSRPTLPDSLPVVGQLPDVEGLFINAGHQHIGFATGPATAKMLGDAIFGKSTEHPFLPKSLLPSRYISRIKIAG